METNNPRASIFSFPFVILVDTRDPPHLEMMQVENNRVRVYPPFRSAPANWIPMPTIPSYSVPFLKNCRPKHIKNDGSVLMSLAAYPQLEIPNIQKASIQLVWGERWDKDNSPILFPMDSLRLDLIPPQDTASDEMNWEMITNRIIGHVRCLTRQWWISRSSDVFLGWMRNEFPVDQFGKPKGDIYASSKARSPSGIELPLNRHVWSRVLRETEAGHDPNVIDQLLLDAEYFHVSGEMRRLTLDAATACEIAKDEAFQRLWSRTRTGQFRRGKAVQGWDIGEHLDINLQNLAGRSLKVEKPQLYTQIKELWDTRGNVAHGEPAYFRRSGSRIDVAGDVAKQLIRAARECVEWLRSL